MPLDATSGEFICPACGGRFGLLPEGGSAADAPAEFICTDCPSADLPATQDSATNPEDGHRHSVIDPGQVSAFYNTDEANQPASIGDTAPAPDQHAVDASFQAATGATPKQAVPADQGGDAASAAPPAEDATAVAAFEAATGASPDQHEQGGAA